jgi:3-oxoadipate CoA-transferase alpha subunit
MINKFVAGPDEKDAAIEALADVEDGASVMVGGFGIPGQPVELVEALRARGVCGLTIIANNAGAGDEGLGGLIGAGRVRKVICSYPRQATAWHFIRAYKAGEIELELVPQGTLSERIRAGGSGVAAFYVRTGYGTDVAADKETRVFDDSGYVLERALTADFAFLRGHSADRWGNVVYRGAGINFAPVMAAASATSVIQVENLVELGDLDPNRVDTPGIHVDRVVHVANPRHVDRAQ